MSIDLNNVDLSKIVTVAKKAGNAIKEIYCSDFKVEEKADKSPLTEADKASHAIISEALKDLYPSIPILSEEGSEIPYEARSSWRVFWLIDPLDGTKEFIKRNGEFTVNIALVIDGMPVLGVVYAPILDVCYYAKKGEGAYKDGIKLPSVKTNTYKVVASKSHKNEETEAFIEALKSKHPDLESISIGSSLKLCLVAEGAADIYPRLGPTMEWDTAAAHAVVSESGKRVYDFDTQNELVYNKANLFNPWFAVE